MSVYSYLRNIGITVLSGGILIGGFLLGAEANAEDVEPQEQKTVAAKTIDAPVQKEFKKLEKKNNLPGRRFIADFTKSPLDDFDANSKAWYSINQLLGRGNDLLARELKLDKHILGRIGQVAVLSYLNYTTEYYSHELAHNYETRKKGWFDGVRLDWSDWSMSFPKYRSPAYAKWLYNSFSFYNSLYGRAEKEEKEYIRTITNGLNQDELDAALVHRESVLKKNLTFDEAISYLIPKNLDWGYILISTKGGLNYKADYKPLGTLMNNDESTADPNIFPSVYNQGLWNDIDTYLHHLHRKGFYRAHWSWGPNIDFKGIELTKKELFFQALIADALSIKTYDSIKSLYNYIVKGERNTKPFTFNLGRTEITPPQISHFLTKDGSFYDTNAFFNIAGKILFEANLGTDVDFIGCGKVRHLRTGGKLHMQNKGINFRPFLYLNSSRGKIFQYKGIAAGLEMAIGSPGMFEIFAKIGFNENDMIENDVKGKPNGFDFSAGLKITY
ncbi:MAG: hypothetical protein KAT43_02735 [Nanoarchaeota archaeon]|nr:hypothetical protein [Nanoarchaeota archaeon]